MESIEESVYSSISSIKFKKKNANYKIFSNNWNPVSICGIHARRTRPITTTTDAWKIVVPSCGWFHAKDKTRIWGPGLDYTDLRSMEHCGTLFFDIPDMVHGRSGEDGGSFTPAISSVRNSRSNPCEPIWRANGKIIHRLPAWTRHGTSRGRGRGAERRILTVNVKHVGKQPRVYRGYRVSGQVNTRSSLKTPR